MSLYPATGFPQLLPENGVLCDHSDMRFPLGEVVKDTYGNFFRYVKANEAIAVGEIVTHVVLGVWDTTIVVDGAITANTTDKLHIDTLTTAVTAGQYNGYYVSQATAAGLGKLFRIKGHQAIGASGEGDLTLTEKMTEAFADGVALLIYNPFLVELTDADTETIVGVGVGTITSGNYGFVQIGGIHSGVLCDGSNGTAVVLNEPVVPYGSDPGQGQGCTENDSTSDFEVANSPLIALAASTVDAGYVPAKFVRVV